MPYLAAIIEELKGDSELTVGLAKWEFTDGTEEPAVFSQDPAPEECEQPLITVVQGPVSASPMKGKRSAFLSFTIKIWGNKNESGESIRRLGFRIWEVLDAKTYTISGTKNGAATLTLPPTFQRDADGYPSYVITQQVKITES